MQKGKNQKNRERKQKSKNEHKDIFPNLDYGKPSEEHLRETQEQNSNWIRAQTWEGEGNPMVAKSALMCPGQQNLSIENFRIPCLQLQVSLHGIWKKQREIHTHTRKNYFPLTQVRYQNLETMKALKNRFEIKPRIEWTEQQRCTFFHDRSSRTNDGARKKAKKTNKPSVLTNLDTSINVTATHSQARA